jgi:glycerol-3-phosphate O-acyltransferase
LNHQFTLEQKVVNGPLLKNSRRMRNEILRNEEFKEAVEELAQELNKDPASLMKQAGRYLKEIGADFRIWAIEFFCMVLAIIWNRIYVGIEFDEDRLDEIREAGKKAPIVVVPMHRSHIDYLVVSYLFYNRGLIAPHIAAGNNLAFFPIGPLFRRAGAFFIRRSFWNNRVYALAFRYYVRKMVKEGYWLEFFPEGGRSRTGKSLPPRMGMIRELVECVEAGVAEDLYFCPLAICYEKIVEEATYHRELSGLDKKSESVGGMLRASKVLASKYGKVYLRFSEPISVKQYLQRYRREHNIPEGELDSRMMRSFAYSLMSGMNDATIVTPSTLVATVLLAHPRKGLSRSQLVRRVAYLMLYFQRKGAHFSETLQKAWDEKREQLESPPSQAERERSTPGNLAYGTDLYRVRVLGSAVDDVVEETVNMFIHGGSLTAVNYGDELVYTPVLKNRLKLDFFKNNSIHHLAHDALLATALLSARGGESIVYERLRKICYSLSRLLKREFIYRPGDTFDGQFFEALGRFIEAGWVSENDDGTFTVHDDADELVVFFANSIQPYVEGYWLTVTHLIDLKGTEIAEKDWTRSLHRRARALVAAEKLQFAEASSHQIFSNAVRAMADLDLVSREKVNMGHQTGRKARSVYMLKVSDDQLARMEELLPDLERAHALL